MKIFAKTCGFAMARALLNGMIALLLMLLVEFSVSGHLEAYPHYITASILITTAFFIYNLSTQRRRPAQPPPSANQR